MYTICSYALLFIIFDIVSETPAPSFCTNTCFCFSSRLARCTSVGTLAGPPDSAHDPHARKHEKINDPVYIKVIPRYFIPGKSGKNLQKTSNDGTGFDCSVCGRIYKLKSSLRNHQKWECGKEPQFKCPYCVYKAKQKMHMARHMERMHKEIDYSAVKAELGLKVENTETD